MDRLGVAAIVIVVSTAAAGYAAQGRGNGRAAGNPHSGVTPPGHAGAPKEHGPKATPAGNPRVTTSTPTDHAMKNPRLEQRLQMLLPAGTSVADGAAGFKNWGQFVAAAHVSHNLDIPFFDLKARMTGGSAVSLGDAIQALRPDIPGSQAASAAKKAETDAAADLRESE